MYRLGLGLGLGMGNGFYSFFFFSALKSDEHLCGDATCGNVVCDVLRLSPCTKQPCPLGGSCDRGHEMT